VAKIVRLALGRTILRESDFFLLDKSLSNIDANLRAKMLRETSESIKTLT
jgi:ABC-type sugar transport system ATPase subunit